MYTVSANETKTCRKCGDTKPIDDFYPTYQKGKHYRRARCKDCDNELRKARTRTEPTQEQKQEWSRRQAQRRKRRRKDPEHYAKFIYWDTRKSDKKHGRENDFTKEYIAEQIAKGCSYCGEKDLRMTLDRIDNEKGHTMDNTVPACIRCNYVRGNMPYEAWVLIARAMKRARKQGAFGDWTGRAR